MVKDLTWSAGASPTPCWPPLMLMKAALLHLAVPSLSLQALCSPEDEGLPQCVHLLAQWIWNYSSSGIHTYMLTVRFPALHMHTQKADCAITQFERKDFPQPLPSLLLSDATARIADADTDDSSRKRVISLFQLVS